MRESNDERRRLPIAAKEKENVLSLVKANENAQRKQMKWTSILGEGLSKVVTDFECRVTEVMKRSNLRLEKIELPIRLSYSNGQYIEKKGIAI